MNERMKVVMDEGRSFKQEKNERINESLSIMPYDVESLLEVYEVNEDFLVVFYAFSSICFIGKTRSIVLLPGLNPACSSPSALSTYCFILFCINLAKTFPGMLWRLMPL